MPEDEIAPGGREQLGSGHVVLIVVLLSPLLERMKLVRTRVKGEALLNQEDGKVCENENDA
jgi:hypothetical protein